jgi:hypothetical protein
MTNGVATIESGTAERFTDPRLVCTSDGKTPRGGLNFNRGFVELGHYTVKRLERKPIFEFHAWNAPQPAPKKENDPDKPQPDPLRLARYYQSLLDTGK